MRAETKERIAVGFALCFLGGLVVFGLGHCLSPADWVAVRSHARFVLIPAVIVLGLAFGGGE